MSKPGGQMPTPKELQARQREEQERKARPEGVAQNGRANGNGTADEPDKKDVE